MPDLPHSTSERLLPDTSACHLLAIPGTSPHLVARYLTGVGNVDDVLQVNRVFIHLLQHDEPFDPPNIQDYPAFRRQLYRYLAEKKRSRQPKSNKRRRPRK